MRDNINVRIECYLECSECEYRVRAPNVKHYKWLKCKRHPQAEMTVEIETKEGR